MAPHRIFRQGADIANRPSTSSNSDGYGSSSPPSGSPIEDVFDNFETLMCGTPLLMQCSVRKPIRLIGSDPDDVVKMLCSNVNCKVGKFMHSECHRNWEKLIFRYFAEAAIENGHSNYEMVYRYCECRCGNGYLQKDRFWTTIWDQKELDLVDKLTTTIDDLDAAKTTRLTGDVTLLNFSGDELSQKETSKSVFEPYCRTKTRRKTTRSSTSTSCSELEQEYEDDRDDRRNFIIGASSPLGGDLNRKKKDDRDDRRNFIIGASSPLGGDLNRKKKDDEDDFKLGEVPHDHVGANPIDLSNLSMLEKRFIGFRKSQNLDWDLVTCESMTGAGLFYKRENLRDFFILPRHRRNSINIKAVDEGNNNNDDLRSFVLSSLWFLKLNTVNCVLCSDTLKVYDRYPLINGLFFLSPVEHRTCSIKVNFEDQKYYLSAVCILCTHGNIQGRRIRCRTCFSCWDGSALRIGTLYTYDIFAAHSCCDSKLKCNVCEQQITPETNVLNFFSDYSRRICCPHCGIIDYHFVKPLVDCYALEMPP